MAVADNAYAGTEADTELVSSCRCHDRAGNSILPGPAEVARRDQAYRDAQRSAAVSHADANANLVTVPTTGRYLVIDGVIHTASRAYVEDVTDTGTDWRVSIDVD
ncbi:hypothetical protein ACFWPU_00855 [Streptomyces sp. NPDC058471]|uniref:hypothetical protein n=1 Tax=Streptomyces sp. NPDC058471 TaxID=3346516 RepID=UPI0036478910